MPGEPDEDLAGVTVHDDLGLAGLEGDQTITFFAPEELTSPASFEVAALAEADLVLASTDTGDDGVGRREQRVCANNHPERRTGRPEQAVLSWKI